MRRAKKECFSFAELVRRSGVPRSSCQYYVTIGLIPNSGKNKRGWTLYDEESVRVVKLTREFTTSGFTTSEIRQIYRKLTINNIENKFRYMPIEDFRQWLKSKGIRLKR